MTTTGSSAPRPARARQLQEDLLQDLLHTAPQIPSGGGQPARPGRPGAVRGQTPTVDIRVTPTSWASLSLRSVPGRPGVVLSAGPIRVSLSHFGG
jgi:hypothetical protein